VYFQFNKQRPNNNIYKLNLNKMKSHIKSLFTKMELKATEFKNRQIEKMAEKITAKIDKKINLTDEQQINIDMLTNSKAIMEDKNDKSMKSKHNKTKEIMKEEWAEFKSILTEEQFNKIKHFKKIEKKLG